MDKEKRPHRERGERLRRRREELQTLGRLPDNWDDILKRFRQIAEELGEKRSISVSGFQQWERGETWPNHRRKAALASLMEWTEGELDGHNEGDAVFHPTSPQEIELIALWRGLQGDQRTDLIAKLRAAVRANQELQKHAGDEMRLAPNARVSRYIKPAPTTPHASPSGTRRTKARTPGRK